MTNSPMNTPRLYLPVVMITITVIGLLIYADSLRAPFVFDDSPNIVRNHHIRLTEITPEALAEARRGLAAVRPVAYLTFAFNYYAGGYDPFGYHVVNTAIHLINAGLVFFIARRIMILIGLNGLLPPFFAALLWLVNPVHTQSVTYVVQRVNSLAAMFYLLAFFFYIHARTAQIERDRLLPAAAASLFLLSFSFGALALFTKEIAATLPIMILACEWYFFQDLKRSRLKQKIKWPAAAAVVLIIIIVMAFIYLEADPRRKITAGYAGQSFTMGQRLLTQPQVILYYLSLLAFPHPARLNLDHDFPVSLSLISPLTTGPALLALAALPVLAAFAVKRRRLLSFAVLWFLVSLAVESSFIGLAMIFEHRTYLPSVFPVIALSCLLCSGKSLRPAAIGVLCTAIIVSGVWTRQRNHVWADKIALWQDVVDKSPLKARPWNGLGQALQKAGRTEEALVCFEKAVAFDPEYNEAVNNIGGALLDMGRPDQAVGYLRRALALNPGQYKAYNNLGIAMHHLGRPDEALFNYRRALSIHPDHAMTHNNLGTALLEQGNITEAVFHLQEAIRIDPGYYDPYNNLGLAMSRQGQIDRAIACYQKALDLNPAGATAHFNLGSVFFQKNDLDRAVRHLDEALRHDPRSVPAANNLATVLVKQKKYPRAEKVLHHLAGLRPESPVVFYNLACVYSLMGEKEQALVQLEKAIDLGYRRWDHLKSDPDLDNIRSTEGYRRLTTESQAPQPTFYKLPDFLQAH